VLFRSNDKVHLESDDTTAGFIRHIDKRMKETIVEDNTWSHFIQLEIRYDIEMSLYFLIFDDSVL
jgi:hypothetical protein